MRLLIDLARAANLEERRDQIFSGAHINTSEDRAVLHTALRLPRDAELTVDGQNVVEDVHAVLDAMGAFTDRLRSGEWTGATGKRINTVVNIGIGGSDLGPVMVYPGAAPLRRRGGFPRASCPTSIPPTLSQSLPTQSRPQRFSSSHPRRSPHLETLPLRRPRGAG